MQVEDILNRALADLSKNQEAVITLTPSQYKDITILQLKNAYPELIIDLIENNRYLVIKRAA